ncbi:hypothetical protein L1887_36811 [Cichorium endivia]|nr:hypothetical protein L1887_36811 [Cichorium endivia]
MPENLSSRGRTSNNNIINSPTKRVTSDRNMIIISNFISVLKQNQPLKSKQDPNAIMNNTRPPQFFLLILFSSSMAAAFH